MPSRHRASEHETREIIEITYIISHIKRLWQQKKKKKKKKKAASASGISAITNKASAKNISGNEKSGRRHGKAASGAT